MGGPVVLGLVRKWGCQWEGQLPKAGLSHGDGREKRASKGGLGNGRGRKEWGRLVRGCQRRALLGRLGRQGGVGVGLGCFKAAVTLKAEDTGGTAEEESGKKKKKKGGERGGGGGGGEGGKEGKKQN